MRTFVVNWLYEEITIDNTELYYWSQEFLIYKILTQRATCPSDLIFLFLFFSASPAFCITRCNRDVRKLLPYPFPALISCINVTLCLQKINGLDYWYIDDPAQLSYPLHVLIMWLYVVRLLMALDSWYIDLWLERRFNNITLLLSYFGCKHPAAKIQSHTNILI